MANDEIPEYTIIGASPAGFTFALSLLHHNPSLSPSSICILEKNPDFRKPGGPFWLAPNALRILDSIKLTAGETIYERVKHEGWRGKKHVVRNEKGEWLGSLPHGDAERWGYDGLRIERGILLKLLAGEVKEKGIRVEYGTSLREVVREDEKGVVFRVRDANYRERERRTKRLIGGDGAHSRTRNFVCGKAIKPAYTGNFMIGGFLPRSNLHWTPEFQKAEENNELALSITDRGGTLLMIPTDYNATKLGIGRQYPLFPQPSREEWEALNADKEGLRSKMTDEAASWSAFPRGILEAAREEDPNMWIVWPMYLLPKLDRWASHGERTVIIGDAAHTLVPAAAQGACQAIEDAWTLAKTYSAGTPLKDWETARIERIEQISKLSVQLMNVRLPPEDQARLSKDELFPLDGSEEERNERIDWLYGYHA